MGTVSPQAAAHREAARRPNGRFGTQHHSAPEPGNGARDLSGLLGALRCLDHELERQGFAERVRVHAVGGFALLWHGLRTDNGYTFDVDSLTDPYDAPVREAIEQVGRTLGMEPAWLNTDVAGDDPEMALELFDARFVATDTKLNRIDLRIADIPTLTRAKAIAVDTDEFSGRERDWPDLLELLKLQRISSYREFCAAYPEINDWEYPETHRSLECWFRTGERGSSGDTDWWQ